MLLNGGGNGGVLVHCAPNKILKILNKLILIVHKPKLHSQETLVKL